jgi:hypothetical protein
MPRCMSHEVGDDMNWFEVFVLVFIVGIVLAVHSCKPRHDVGDDSTGNPGLNSEPSRAWGDLDEGRADDGFEAAAKPLVDWATSNSGGVITVEIKCSRHIGGCSVVRNGGYFIPRPVE